MLTHGLADDLPTGIEDAGHNGRVHVGDVALQHVGTVHLRDAGNAHIVAFGGTIIGWGIALVWAMRAAHRVGSTSSGGESGLNLFINDVKKDSGRRSSAAAPNIPYARAGTPSRSSCPGCNFPG
jgi:hypothetical protein